MTDAIDRKDQRRPIGTLEGAGEQHALVGVTIVFSTPLDQVVVPCKAPVHGAEDLFLQVESLQLGRNQRGHHETLFLARRIPVSGDQLCERLRARLHICILCREISLRKQHVRLEAQIGKLVRRLGKFATGSEKRLTVAIGILQDQQTLLALKDDLQNAESPRLRR